jgi:hypothetical protein
MSESSNEKARLAHRLSLKRSYNSCEENSDNEIGSNVDPSFFSFKQYSSQILKKFDDERDEAAARKRRKVEEP